MCEISRPQGPPRSLGLCGDVTTAAETLPATRWELNVYSAYRAVANSSLAPALSLAETHSEDFLTVSTATHVVGISEEPCLASMHHISAEPAAACCCHKESHAWQVDIAADRLAIISALSPSHHVDLEIDRGLICQHLVRVPVMGMQAEPTWCIHQQSTESVTRKV